MPRLKIVVNPLAGRGHAIKVTPLIRAAFTQLGADFDLIYTSRPGEAIDLARQALDAGYDTVVAVGGDGTTHEVMNGIVSHSGGNPGGVLGCIPVGSGNDFAVMNGAPTDIEAACKLIVAGHTRVIDIGEVIIDGEVRRYFDNVVGIGFDGLVNIEARKLKFVRGLALYLPVVLKTVLFSLRPVHAHITYDGKTMQRLMLMTSISNGPREGGGFHVAPAARCDDGELDMMVADYMSRLKVFGLIPHFMNGTHVGHPGIDLARVKQVEVASEDPLYLHVDGELLCGAAHRIQTRIIPSALRMIAPSEGGVVAG